MKTTITLLSLVLCSMLLLSSGRSFAHGGITIDGDCSTDWGSSVPAQIHTSQLFTEGGGTEWVYRGASGDARIDPDGLGTESNNDIVEVRFTGDSTHLYFCVKMADINDWSIPNINIAVDTDKLATDDAVDWIGDDTCTIPALCNGLPSYAIDSPINFVERQFNAHYTGVDMYPFNSEFSENFLVLFDGDPSSWGSAEANTAVANTVTNIVEGKFAWGFLGCGGGPCSELKINLTTYRNNPNYNESGDTTVNRTDHDGVDLMGGTPGVSQDAWDRDFSDGTLSSFHVLKFDTPTAVVVQDARAFAQSSSEPVLIGLLLLGLLGLIGLKYLRKHPIA